MNDTLTKGTVVKYKDGWMQVRAVFANTVNLGPIFQSRTTFKKVPISEVTPDHDNWYKAWQESDTYKCM